MKSEKEELYVVIMPKNQDAKHSAKPEFIITNPANKDQLEDYIKVAKMLSGQDSTDEAEIIKLNMPEDEFQKKFKSSTHSTFYSPDERLNFLKTNDSYQVQSLASLAAGVIKKEKFKDTFFEKNPTPEQGVAKEKTTEQLEEHLQRKHGIKK